EVRKAGLTVNLVPKSQRSLNQQEFERDVGRLLTREPGARIQFGDASGGGSSLLNIALVSDQPEALQQASARLEREMRGVPGLGNVQSTASLVRPEILITPKADVAALMGVSSADISQVARVATIGD